MQNSSLAAEDPNSAWALATDNGTAPPFKYSFAFSTNQNEAEQSNSGRRSEDPRLEELPLTPIATAIVKLKPYGLPNRTGIRMRMTGNTTSAARDLWESSPRVLVPGRWIFGSQQEFVRVLDWRAVGYFQ